MDNIHVQTGDIEYLLELDQDGISPKKDAIVITTELGYELTLTKVIINLEQMQLYQCENSHGYQWSQPVLAGHGSAEANPAEIRDIQSFDLLNPESQRFSATLNEPEYCTFHMVFARDVQSDEPSFVLEGQYVINGDNPVAFQYESKTAYGKSLELSTGSEGDITLSAVFAVGDSFDRIEFADSPSADNIARSVFENMLADAAITIE